jgi:hypothetical protein
LEQRTLRPFENVISYACVESDCISPHPIEPTSRASRGKPAPAVLRSDYLVNALIGLPRQVLVTRRDDAHRLLGFQVVRVFCSDQDFPGPGSQLIREKCPAAPGLPLTFLGEPSG